jgi:hypothetical protein
MRYVGLTAALPSLPEVHKCDLFSVGVDYMVTFEYSVGEVFVRIDLPVVCVLPVVCKERKTIHGGRKLCRDSKRIARFRKHVDVGLGYRVYANLLTAWFSSSSHSLLFSAVGSSCICSVAMLSNGVRR